MTTMTTTPTTIEPILLRVREAAHLLGVTPRVVEKLIQRGDIPSVKIGRARRLPLAALQAWAKEQEE